MSESVARKIENTEPLFVEALWFVAMASVMKGPFTHDEMLRRLQSKEFSSSDFCWRQGFKEWRPIYSVPQFETSKTELRIAYPTVEVPYAGFEISRLNSVKKKTSTKNNTLVQVNFSRRRQFSLYEWAVAILFTVIFTYVAIHLTLGHIEKNVQRYFEVRNMGIPQRLGDARVVEEISPHFWSPIFSAPSFKELYEEEKYPLKGFVKTKELPVHITGLPRVKWIPGRTPQIELGNWELVGIEVRDLEMDVKTLKYGDVFLKNLIVKGSLSTQNGAKIRIHVPGKIEKVED